ncbi:hypothetical protein EG327_007778 [Venturia inaequalis]|uniref:DUF7730 domain-containing protein n=1 Tax=Venturia inaequalis TaxID=5025 RepID=A0A8H3UVD1_VENIN|nr:hypothetical protein EG327_007778 [Venturia inaequalis]
MSSSAAKAMETTKIGLADIPAELRLKVYRNLFVIGIANLHAQGHVHNSCHKCYKGCICRRALGELETIPPGRKTIRATAQLLRTCKLFYHEGLPVLYGENTFYIYDGVGLNSFLMGGGDTTASYIRSIVLRDAAGMMGRSAPNLSILPSLQELYIFGAASEWDRDAVEDCLPRRLWGSLSLRTQPDQIVWTQRKVPAVGFLRRLFVRYPDIRCGVFVSAELRTRTGLLPSDKFALFHYKIVPHGRSKSRRAFTTEYDQDFPTEEFATAIFEGARPHSETEMSFTNRKCVEDRTGDATAGIFQAHGEAKLPMKLGTSLDDQDMMEATTVNETTSTLQAQGKAETPMELVTGSVDQDLLESEAGEAVRAPEKQAGVFGKIFGCYGWFKTKLSLA